MKLFRGEFLLWVTRIGCLILLFSSGNTNVLAQKFPETYPFYTFSKPEGLSSPKVYSILQDRNDYIWLGTESGLDRFDGKNIETITIDDEIWHGGVYCIFEDSRGVIWFGHLDGRLSYYEGGRFGKVNFDTLSIASDITSITELDNRIWFTTASDGAFSVIFDKNSKQIIDYKQYRGREGLSDQIFSSYVDPKGDLYCMADVSIKRYIPEEDRFINYKPDGLSSHFSTIALFEDSRGDRWFGTNKGGIVRILSGTEEPVYYDIRDGLANNWVACFTEDSRGRIWVGTWGGGVSVFDGDDIFNFNQENGLSAEMIKVIIEDHEGNMLLASYSNGLNILKGDHFVNYDSKRLFSNLNISALSEDKYPRIWFGNNNEITIYDPENGMSKMYPKDAIFNEDEYGPDLNIISIENDLDGNIWVATRFGGILKYVLKTSSFSREDQINEVLPHDPQISEMVIDKENNIWIGTAEGLGVWSNNIGEGDFFTQSRGLASNNITSLFVDKAGDIWIGSMSPNGFTKYNSITGKFEIIDLGMDLSLRVISQSADGILWLGTNRGVYGYKDDSIVAHLTTQDGLLSDDIYVLQTGDDNLLYIGTNNGLNQYNLSTGRVISFTEKNGYMGIQSNRNASIRSADGHLWFGTGGGVTRLKPELIPETEREPLTHIKGLLVELEPRLFNEELKFSFKENSLIIDFYSICVTNPDAVKYKVMLEGADSDWSPETDFPTQHYPSLSPGRYTFKVKASNSYGVWNSVPETFTFTIKPPFYFSAPFLISMAIFLIIAIYLFIKQRERNLIMEKQILEEKVDERTAEVVEKSKVIEEKNRDITASIRYAERIQMAMLPPEDSFEDTFVLFLPKDIVSGDFYWMYDSGDIQFLAAVDCTGHGVPGAFMSIIGSNSLTKIVREYGITRPAAILDQLNVEVTKSLLQRGDTVINDGMDLALISFDKKKKIIEFAGAYNPLVIVRDGAHITIKADRFPIGMSQRRGKKKFTNNEVEVKSGDMLYMFSDGFADQFGGPQLKKFKSLNLKNEFLKISNLPVLAQKDHLQKTLDDWQGDQTQIDDVLIIGTRIP